LVLEAAAGSAGVSPTTSRKWFVEAGGVMPATPASGRVKPRLTFEQREDIAMLKGQKVSDADIARQVGCDRSTVGRELKKGMTRDRDLHQPSYRASTAQKMAEWRARRPKPTKLAVSDRLRAVAQAGLEEERSPEQIANRLPLDYPDDPELRVSHETIYKALYVQGRGELRRDLHRRLRTGRALRKPAALLVSAAAGSRAWSTSPTGPPRPTTGGCPATGKAT
jgi:transposase, IS30 family